MAEARARPRRRSDEPIVDVLALAFCSIVFVVSIYPIYYAFINSINDASTPATKDSLFLPGRFTLDAYRSIIDSGGLGVALTNSIARTAVGSVLHLLVTSMAAYVLTKSNLLFKRLFTTLFLVSMYFSGGLIPTYILQMKLKLLNNFLVYILPSAFSYFNALLLMAYFRGLPQALEESAFLDGGGYLLIFFRIILPLSKPILATIILFSGVALWNDWFSTLFFTSNRNLMTLSAMIMKLLSQTEAQAIISTSEMHALAEGGQSQIKLFLSIQGIRYAAAMLAILPVVIVYPFCQRYFVQGIMLGAIKA